MGILEFVLYREEIERVDLMHFFIKILEKWRNKIIVHPKKSNLTEIISQINDKNLHNQISTGEPVGKEIC